MQADARTRAERHQVLEEQQVDDGPLARIDAAQPLLPGASGACVKSCCSRRRRGRVAHALPLASQARHATSQQLSHTLKVLAHLECSRTP
eukprot:5749099-Pleurochrysis_carterae.AAC.1